MPSMTFRDFATNNALFRVACELAHIPPTRRQASKWHQHRGLAYSKIGEARREMERKAA